MRTSTNAHVRRSPIEELYAQRAPCVEAGALCFSHLRFHQCKLVVWARRPSQNQCIKTISWNNHETQLHFLNNSAFTALPGNQSSQDVSTGQMQVTLRKCLHWEARWDVLEKSGRELLSTNAHVVVRYIDATYSVIFSFFRWKGVESFPNQKRHKNAFSLNPAKMLNHHL